MANWQYDLYAVKWDHSLDTAQLKKVLDARGAQGWELVGVTRDENAVSPTKSEALLFVFKKQAPDS